MGARSIVEQSDATSVGAGATDELRARLHGMWAAVAGALLTGPAPRLLPRAPVCSLMPPPFSPVLWSS